MNTWTVGELNMSERRKVCPFSMILTIDHCTQNWENFQKTIVSDGSPVKKHFMVMVGRWQNHWKTIDGNGALKKYYYHPIVGKKWPSYKSRPRSALWDLWMCTVHAVLYCLQTDRDLLTSVYYCNGGMSEQREHMKDFGMLHMLTLAQLSLVTFFTFV